LNYYFYFEFGRREIQPETNDDKFSQIRFSFRI